MGVIYANVNGPNPHVTIVGPRILELHDNQPHICPNLYTVIQQQVNETRLNGVVIYDVGHSHYLSNIRRNIYTDEYRVDTLGPPDTGRYRNPAGNISYLSNRSYNNNLNNPDHISRHSNNQRNRNNSNNNNNGNRDRNNWNSYDTNSNASTNGSEWGDSEWSGSEWSDNEWSDNEWSDNEWNGNRGESNEWNSH